MYLATGEQLHTSTWTDLPITEQIIHIVDKFSTKGKNQEMTKGYPIFEWSPGIKILDQADSEPENEEAPFHINEENDDIT